MPKITAKNVKIGDIIRKTAPYAYWRDYQYVTDVHRDGRKVVITRENGETEAWSPASTFEKR